MVSGFAEPLQQLGTTFVRWRGRKLIYFGGCDYLRLSSHPALRRAFKSATERYGLTVAASRRTTGNHLLYEEVEDAARRFFSAECAIFVANGYLTNMVAAQGFRTPARAPVRTRATPSGAPNLKFSRTHRRSQHWDAGRRSRPGV